jgi:hypothetical protein
MWAFNLQHATKNICKSGIDIIITIHCGFRQFLVKSLAFISKTNYMVNNFHNLALLRVKTQKKFGENIF